MTLLHRNDIEKSTKERLVDTIKSIKNKDNSNTIYTEINLPSKGIFYSSKKSTIKIAPFTVKQIKGLYSASLITDVYNRERQIVNIIQELIPDIDIFTLTTGDFDFILYWIRLNSYKKSPLVVTWKYTTSAGIDKEVTSVVNSTNLIVQEIPEHKYPINSLLGYSTVKDRLDLLQITDETDKYIGTYASVLKDGKTIQEKIAKLETLSPDIIPEIRDHIDSFNHGVVETVKVRDEEDDTDEIHDVKLSLTLSYFFP